MKLLDRVRAICGRIGNAFEDGPTVTAALGTLHTLKIHHGPHVLLAVDSGTYLTLLYAIDITVEQARMIAAMEPEDQSHLFAILRREMLQGRGGFTLAFDERQTPALLRRVQVEQRIVVADEGPATSQRLADGIQELVLVGMRALMVLGQAFENVRSAGGETGSSPHDGMYG